MSKALEDDLPTLLILGTGDPMQAALEKALAGYATFVEAAESDSAVMAVMTAAPDLVLLLGDAAEAGDGVLRELASEPSTSVVPVVLLSEETGLDRRFDAFRHGAVAVVPRTASVDEMARRIAKLAKEAPERTGATSGELGEASVDEVIALLSKQLKTGILSVSQPGVEDGPAARFVLRAGRPVTEAIEDFVRKIRPLVEESQPLRFEFQEAPAGRISVLEEMLDDDLLSGTDDIFKGRRLLLVDDNPADADTLAQELRALGSLVVVADGEGTGLDRAKALDPEVVLVDEEGLDGWAYRVMSRLRRDPGLRWASVLVIKHRELWPKAGAPPRMDRLGAALRPLLAPDVRLAERAEEGEPFDVRLETVGPTRMLRALCATGLTLHLTVRNPRAVVDIDLAEGLIAGAEALRLDDATTRIGGPGALATLLALSSGRVKVERRDHPAAANLLAPIDDALMAASAETPLVRPSLPPPSMPAPPMMTPDATSLSVPPPEASAIVEELRGLITRLQGGLPPGEVDEEAPTTSLPALPPARDEEDVPTNEMAVSAPAVSAPAVPPPVSQEASRSKYVVPRPDFISKANKPGAPPKPLVATKPAPPPPVIAAKVPVAAPVATKPPRPRATKQTMMGMPAVTLPQADSELKAQGPAAATPEVAPAPEVSPAPAPALTAPVAAPAPSEGQVQATAPPPEVDGFEDFTAGADDGLSPAIEAVEEPPTPVPAPLITAPPVAAAAGDWPPDEGGWPDDAGYEPLPGATPKSKTKGIVLVMVGLVVVGGLLAGTFAFPDDHDTPELMSQGAAPAEVPVVEVPVVEVPVVEPVVEEPVVEVPVVEEPVVEEPGSGQSRSERVESYLSAANFQRNRGNMAIAEQRYLSALRLDRRNGRALAGITKVHIARRHASEAVRYAQRLVRHHPRPPSNHVLHGDALALAGNRAAARRAWQAALERNPNHAGARRRLRR